MKRLGQAALLAGVAVGMLGLAPAAGADPGCHGCSYGTIQDGGRTEPEDNRTPSNNNNNGNDNNNNRTPRPPNEPSPGPVPDDLLAGDVIDLVPPSLVPPELVWPGGLGIGPIYQDNMGNLVGDVGLPNTEPANDPSSSPSGSTRRASGCDFTSGTHNLSDTRAMFPDRCGGPWHPELHKCDYGSDGWRCYAL